MQSAIDTLERQFGEHWSAIRSARARTEEVIGNLRSALADYDDPDFSIVVTGSLGRGEATKGSDADWVFLIDGRSDPEHAMLAREVGKRVLEVVGKKPGRTGTFGDIVASHELVHYIAGTRDTNENLTRRILLLSESRALTNPRARERVIRNVLARYVVYDRPVRRQNVPHFLLNDVVRYWRTMASDYASKMWEREREGWAIRNVKLRFSRKVLFMRGLISSFAAELLPSDELHRAENDDEYCRMIADLIASQSEVTPLEMLARVVADCDDREVGRAIFSSYDKFLSVLADDDARKKLEAAPFEGALAEPAFADLRNASQSFRNASMQLFFDAHPRLPGLIRKFGLF